MWDGLTTIDGHIQSELVDARETIDRLQEAVKSKPKPLKTSQNELSKKSKSQVPAAIPSDDDEIQEQGVESDSAPEVTLPRKPKKNSKKACTVPSIAGLAILMQYGVHICSRLGKHHPTILITMLRPQNVNLAYPLQPHLQNPRLNPSPDPGSHRRILPQNLHRNKRM